MNTNRDYARTWVTEDGEVIEIENIGTKHIEKIITFLQSKEPLIGLDMSKYPVEKIDVLREIHKTNDEFLFFLDLYENFNLELFMRKIEGVI